ncbi:hypothetical protein WR25_13739 [Diploscapter pachys]|uniref:Palmitoyltransferase n=1 Tax=Diploscapter pachys TaxID=2018661 RepID=A0A2A2J6V5_9BILA|nr:hypothetical protein WR25_13739 [Diploscapter pachys]
MTDSQTMTSEAESSALTGDTNTAAASDSCTSVSNQEPDNTPRATIEPPDWPAPFDRADVMKGLGKRLLHYGPIVALCIIFFVGTVTSFFANMYLAIDTLPGTINLLVFLFWNYATITNMCLAAYVGPGYEEHESRLQWCTVCEGYKAPRSHHCSKCGRCCLKMDHHCPWVNNCVGHRNQGYFIRFLFYAICGCLHAFCMQISLLYVIFFGKWLVSDDLVRWDGFSLTLPLFFAFVIASALSLSVTLALSFLLYVQIKSVWKNETAIEEYIEAKIHHHGSVTGRRFVYPYNLGWKRNIRYVLGSYSGRPEGNGYWWPVLEGCDQYTLTEEQLALKKRKMQAARPGKAIGDFSSRRCLCLQFGCRTCCTQPIIDGGMLEVHTEDRVMLTRATRHWFYGYRNDDATKKGWIPRALVVPVKEEETTETTTETSEDSDRENVHKGDKKND